MKYFFLITLSLIVLSSCADETGITAPELAGSGAPKSLAELNTLSGDFKVREFILPDSLKNGLLIAAYEEMMPLQGTSFIVYTDSLRDKVVKVTHLRDSSGVKSEKLIRLKDNEFKSVHTEERYLIRSDMVYRTYTSGSMSHSQEYLRLDPPQAAVDPR